MFPPLAACPKSTLLIPAPESGYILNGLTALPPVTLCMARYGQLHSEADACIITVGRELKKKISAFTPSHKRQLGKLAGFVQIKHTLLQGRSEGENSLPEASI